ncbi:MAG TPA: SGNH/GDSL hydrolase family protein [Vicinamibacterales bacterium]|nr:SGNH/GDSL hydrolase family protein [Vicinamibacterales bacterium]
MGSGFWFKVRFKVLGALFVAALLAGCSSDSPTEPSPTPNPTAPVVYTALGASDALGIGGSADCLPFAECPNGTGYVQVIARTLRSTRTVTLANLGIPAAVLSPRIQTLGRQYGRFIPANFLDAELPGVARDSTLVTIFTGANDANAIGDAVEQGAGGSNVAAFIDDQIRQFAAEYRQLITGVRSRAGQPRIVVANLPNFAGVPYTTGYPPLRRQAIQTLSVRLTREAINTLTSDGVAVVDLMCDGRSYEPGRYSADGFHPNDAGYAFLAELMLRAINDAGFPAPQNDCSFMRIVS